MLFGIPLATEETDPLKLRDSLRTRVSKELQRFALEYAWVEVHRPNIQAQRQLEARSGKSKTLTEIDINF